ncbi:MAG TPA: hypothetical protein PK176_14240 [Acidobacteriota bacterium]|nr:hypothetical protein [Acidobacteriota bacterium]HQM64465.1 hypothetical protein [Acidobacteriota bacterium]
MNPEFEQAVARLTRPLNGQYPRPWMTRLADPLQAKVFVVGKNQAKTFSESLVRSQAEYLDCLFNRNGRSCRGLYDRATGGAPSPTRKNIDRLGEMLRRAGVDGVLETNVICYSTPMSEDLTKEQHAGGRARGTEIFGMLLAHIRPQVIIAHGADTRKELARVLGAPLPEPPTEHAPLAVAQAGTGDYRPWVFVLPSLSPPAYNTWSRWADRCLAAVACRTAELLHLPAPAADTAAGRTEPSRTEEPVLEFHIERRKTDMTHQSNEGTGDIWVETFKRWFDVYGSGEQTSRASFKLRGDKRRFCKLEIPGQQRLPVYGISNAPGRILTLMTRNFSVNIGLLAEQLKAAGYSSTIREKYLEVPVASIADAQKVLRIFIGMNPSTIGPVRID